MIASAGSTGTQGARKPRSRSGRVRRSTMTPAETSTKANSVPMLTISSSLSIGNTVAVTATTTPTSSVIRTGRAVPARPGELSRQQPVARHREQHPGLPQHQHHDDGRQPGQRADRDDRGRPVDPVERERGRQVGCVPASRKLGVAHHPRQHDRHGHVEDGDDGQRGQDPAGHVALRVLGLLGGGGDDVEADEREEHDRGARQQRRTSRSDCRLRRSAVRTATARYRCRPCPTPPAG